jgi:nucleoside-diphosphate-sugar epimerase
VLGRRAVARLVAAGIEVTGAARSDRNDDLRRRLGATPQRVDLFDREALVGAVAGHDVVLNLATAVPTGERAASMSAWEDHHRIRREASHNLVDAALEAGGSRCVQESIALLYADGDDRLLDESAPVEPVATTSSALDAEAAAARFAGRGGAGVVLRFGTFYGARQRPHTRGDRRRPCRGRGHVRSRRGIPLVDHHERRIHEVLNVLNPDKLRYLHDQLDDLP